MNKQQIIGVQRNGSNFLDLMPMKKNLGGISSSNVTAIFLSEKRSVNKDSTTIIIRQVNKAETLDMSNEKRVGLYYKKAGE